MLWILDFLVNDVPQAFKERDPEAEAQENYENSEPSWPAGSETTYDHPNFNKYNK